MQRVCVTGIGIVTPLGHTRETTWHRIVNGDNAADKITLFDAKGWPVDIACEVRDFHLLEDAVLAEQKHLLNRPTEFGVQAAFEAITDAGLGNRTYDPYRLGVSMGTGIGAIKPADILMLLKTYPVAKGFDQMAEYLSKHWSDPSLIRRNHPAMLTAILAKRYDARAFQATYTTACAAGAQAIGYAYARIKRGECDVVLAGGADSLAGELLHAGFCMLGVLSHRIDEPKQASRPFDRQRDGFVASEGGAVLVLESFEHAQKRSAKIYGEIIGYGESENAYRITDLPEDARGATSAMTQALRDSRLRPEELDLVNAHGTSTEQNDRVEALAIEKVLNDQGGSPAVTANKSQIGHFVAAAGAVEAAISLLSLRHQLAPPIINLEDSDCSTRLDFVRENSRPMQIETVLSNSFGFGGTNASIIFQKVRP